MKWRVRKPGARRRYEEMWHKHFTWTPTRIPTDGHMSGMNMMWLGWAERKVTITVHCCHVSKRVEYRLNSSNNKTK